MQFEPVLPRQFRDKPLVLVRLFSAQLVIDMRNRQDDPQLGPQLQQQAKQRHGIRPARNRRRQAVPRPNRPLLPNCLQQPPRQLVHGEMLQESVPSTQQTSASENWVLVTGYWVLLCCPTMWGASRWVARFLLLAMLAPAFGPLAMPCAALPGAMHCQRQPASAPSAQPPMHCHHAMAQPIPPHPESSEASFQAADTCCQNHRCCCDRTSEWAQPASSALSFVSLLVERALPSPTPSSPSSDVSRLDSARAPPRS